MTLRATIELLCVGQVEERWPGRPPSAIAKRPTGDRVKVTASGLALDSQADLSVHGGPEKAIHHYAADHYPAWRSELVRDDLQPGGFGENISTSGLTEDILCIGDILTFGTATVQVSQGRQPCWKLNAHTNEKRMAALFQKTARTGWYYRVLEPGTVKQGDTISLVERLWPEWTVQRVTQARLTRRIGSEAAATLSRLPALSESWRTAFARISEKDLSEDTTARLGGK
ncbi:MOSC domain-containing protein [Amorphus orientalis]|uniref:MOSC domain-containing protein YiiM n=1 Tax=Amorphus orientalis TaxID=649198 RepID=A0AAE3VKR4_9HYPH|nr:MOSC domain-containing protein [Amorphus orientalis]MDQ0313743.1 MOSC domain-containing protein YiiM [Amorphus orientalis]